MPCFVLYYKRGSQVSPQVNSKDSLPGVSLKYGISMADLRRANHLWSSDSIHFRKVLYIPLEKASRTSQSQTDHTPIAITPSGDSTSSMESTDSSVAHDTDKESLPTDRLVGTIRRIPVSRLSFFPPPSFKDTVSQSAQPPYARVPPAPNKPSYHNRFASSPSLTSILTALPISTSTRDTIMARLSFDSVSSSYSDRDEAEYPHDGLELDDVGHVLLSNGHAEHRVSDESQYLHLQISQPARHQGPTVSQLDGAGGDCLHPPITPKASKPSTRPSPTSLAQHSGLQRGNLSVSPQAYIPRQCCWLAQAVLNVTVRL